MKTIAIVAGGNLTTSVLGDIKSHDIQIGVDRGAWWLLEHGIVPEYAIGDFDSVSPEELQIIQESSPNVVQYGVEKDETDLELAVQLGFKLSPKTIHVYGSVGSRFDHSLAGIFLLEAFEDTDIAIRDENNELVVISKEKTVKKNKNFPYCSLIPLTSTATITLQGFKYPLKKEILYRNKTRGISNELAKSTGRITVHEGKVLCIQSRG